MKTNEILRKQYVTPEIVAYGSISMITRESSNGDSLDAPIQAGQTFSDATFS